MADADQFLPTGTRVEVAAEMFDSTFLGRIDLAGTVNALRRNLLEWGIAIEQSHGSYPSVTGGAASFDLLLIVNADAQYTVEEVRAAVESELTSIAAENKNNCCTVTGVRVIQFTIPTLAPVDTGAPPPTTKQKGRTGDKKEDDSCGFFDKLPVIGDPKCGGSSGFGFSGGVIVTLGIVAAAVVGFTLVTLRAK